MKKFLSTKVKDMNAITLIALVITIVVLIILAAVAINLSLGNNGIFNRAKTAKEQYQNATQYEQAEVAKTSNEIYNYVEGNRGISDAQVKSMLQWKLIGNIIGTTNTSLPSEFNELYIKVNGLTLIVPYQDLTNTKQGFRLGLPMFQNNFYGQICEFGISKTEINLNYYYTLTKDGYSKTNDTASMAYSVYYR